MAAASPSLLTLCRLGVLCTTNGRHVVHKHAKVMQRFPFFYRQSRAISSNVSSRNPSENSVSTDAIDDIKIPPHSNEKEQNSDEDKKDTSKDSDKESFQNVLFCIDQVKPFVGMKAEYSLSFSRWRHSVFAKYLLGQLCPSIFHSKYLKSDCLRGAEQSIKYVYSMLLKGEYEALSECVDESLLSRIVSLFKAIQSVGFRLDLEITNVKLATVYDINLIFGVQRQVALLRNLKQLHLFGGHHLITPAGTGVVAPPVMVYCGSADGPVMLPLTQTDAAKYMNEKADDKKERDSKGTGLHLSFSAPETVNEAMHVGGVVRLDVLCDVEQRLVLTDTSESSNTHTFPKSAKHHLRFEMNLDPEKRYLAGLSSPRYEGGFWKLIDLNGLMLGNYPVDFTKLLNVVVHKENPSPDSSQQWDLPPKPSTDTV